MAEFSGVPAYPPKLADFPRLYEVDSRYGEDVRRISLMGQHILYDVDDQARKVRVLAVVGQRQNPHTVS
ncbi:plasmid stabilization system domain protein [Klebsiella pneumoniae]|uniref:plasmid stabilization system domain protein n=1 Tax=Klebsiella pneumoniae TaxID=573 RepID=UPI000C7B8097|nr:plasmid stabilization system domain protein [Klebsiella pneumoniae]